VVGEHAVVFATVSRVRSGRGRRPRFLEVLVEDATGSLVVGWFRPAPYIADFFAVGRAIVLMGAVEQRAGALRMAHPEYEDASRDGGVHRGLVVPIYGTSDGLGLRTLRGLVAQAFDRFDRLDDPAPPGLRAELGLPSRRDALRAIHFPETTDDVPALRDGTHAAHAALLWEDLFVLQVALLRRRFALPDAGDPGPPAGLVDRLRGRLPFALTGAQERALAALRREIAKPRPMQRLLQGDVGSGKTVVGLLTAAAVVDRGGQVAVLAPTEVLAAQWAARARGLFEAAGVRVSFLSGSLPAAGRRAALQSVASGDAAVMVGTHAVAEASVEFADLRLVIVDEQQRFGVFQRSRLLQKGRAPHLLAMTATPIPRTLALTLFGDLDLTVLDERPARGRIATEIVGARSRGRAYEAVAQAVAAGGRAYVVCPRVEGRGSGRSVVDTAEELAMGPLRGARLGVLHGRMDGPSKEAAIAAFRDGRIEVLVATTVVEVGVDVPEATTIVVEAAERFGLAQLHQLRGRVGRGGADGRCFLVPGTDGPHPRLDVIASTDDGFRVAQADLALRGPGDLVGARQAGAPAFRLSLSPRFGAIQRAAHAAAEDVARRPDWDDAHELEALREAVAVRIRTPDVGLGG